VSADAPAPHRFGSSVGIPVEFFHQHSRLLLPAPLGSALTAEARWIIRRACLQFTRLAALAIAHSHCQSGEAAPPGCQCPAISQHTTLQSVPSSANRHQDIHQYHSLSVHISLSKVRQWGLTTLDRASSCQDTSQHCLESQGPPYRVHTTSWYTQARLGLLPLTWPSNTILKYQSFPGHGTISLLGLSHKILVHVSHPSTSGSSS